MKTSELKALSLGLTGLPLNIKYKYNRYNHKNATCITIKEYRCNNSITSIECEKITFNIGQLKDVLTVSELHDRGFNTKDKKTFYIQVLLHEVAHYKQAKKYKKRFFTLYAGDETKMEKTADRYARLNYKRIIEAGAIS